MCQSEVLFTPIMITIKSSQLEVLIPTFACRWLVWINNKERNVGWEWGGVRGFPLGTNCYFFDYISLILYLSPMTCVCPDGSGNVLHVLNGFSPTTTSVSGLGFEFGYGNGFFFFFFVLHKWPRQTGSPVVTLFYVPGARKSTDGYRTHSSSLPSSQADFTDLLWRG